MIDSLNNFIHIFNEAVILLSIWSLFLFSNYVPDPAKRHEFGWNFLYLLAFNFTVNLIVLIFMIIDISAKKCKRFYKLRQIRKLKKAHERA